MAQLGVNNKLMIFLIIFIFSCSDQNNKNVNDFKIKSTYNQFIGDTLRLYTFTCGIGEGFCVHNLNELSRLRYIGITDYSDTTKESLMGQTKMYSHDFICVKQGAEKIIFSYIHEFENCDSISENRFNRIQVFIHNNVK
jgi:hypothetical protein